LLPTIQVSARATRLPLTNSASLSIIRLRSSSLTQQLGLKSYVLYSNDYGEPVGMRLAVTHPERVRAIIVQNAVAHEQGLGLAWDVRKAFWMDRAAYEDKVIPGFTSIEGAKVRRLGSMPRTERYDPAAWEAEGAHLAQPGQRQIQSDLF
jgi:pimeloyl-ACP methyl ester carboxylesterase